MADRTWRVVYQGMRDSLSDAGLDFIRGEPIIITDYEKAMYFLTKNRFEVEELGEYAEAKKEQQQNRPNETISNELEPQHSDVVVNNRGDIEPVQESDTEEEVNNNPELPTAQTLAQNLIARSQLAGITTDPKVKQEPAKQTPKKAATRQPNTRKKKEVTSTFLDEQMLSDDDLK